MIYLIYGPQNIRIKSQIKAIAKKVLPEIDPMNYVIYDGTQTLIQECVDDANFMPLGYDYKVVIVENCYFLSKEKTKVKIDSEQDFSVLLNYIKNPNEQCDLILTLPSTDIDTKNEIYKEIDKNYQVVSLKDPTPAEWIEVAKKYCTEKLNVKIDTDALRELANRTNSDYGLLYNSASKLALYTDHISLKDVLLMVTRPLEDNSFQLFNDLMNQQNAKALSLFRDLKVTNVSAVTLISLLAGQFRLLDQVFYLFSQSYTVEQTAKELNISNPVRVTIMSKYFRKITSAQIKKVLEDLYTLDKNIKSGQIDRDYGFELFLLNFKLTY